MIYSFLTPYKKTPYTEGWGEKNKIFSRLRIFFISSPPYRDRPCFPVRRKADDKYRMKQA